ncbi:hypothetical protein [Pseudoxanthomonas suwonensis]|uniref:hypothetical protein n=1 Tax=Pseudoxanthomonas suwonensis TaxID=314722 RepID=UPI0004B59661|nr:hypothetical protein [Pseudoxanthomonas suwonensis]
MRLLKTAAVGALAWYAWRAWQRRNTGATFATGRAREDTGTTTAPHGDPTFPRAAPDLTGPELGEPAHAGAQSSRGLGEA